MFQTVSKKLLWMAALMAAGLTFSAGSAEAGWWHRNAGYCGWYGYGYYPAYVYAAPCYRPCVARCGWSCRSACWSGCYCARCNPCWTSWYGSCGVLSDCCGSVVIESKGESEAAPTPAEPAAEQPAAPAQAPTPAQEPAPVQEPAPAPAQDAAPAPPAADPKAVPAAPDVNLPPLPDMPALPPAPGDAPKPTADLGLPADAAQLTVVVPADAQVFVNGMLTTTRGVERRYVSYGLKPGFHYTYEVRAVVTRDGESFTDVQVVRVRVGESRDLAFDFAAQPQAVIAARLP